MGSLCLPSAQPGTPRPSDPSTLSLLLEVRTAVASQFPDLMAEYTELFPIGPYRADAVIPSRMIAVMLDTQRDLLVNTRRTTPQSLMKERHLTMLGWTVVRIPVNTPSSLPRQDSEEGDVLL